MIQDSPKLIPTPSKSISLWTTKFLIESPKNCPKFLLYQIKIEILKTNLLDKAPNKYWINLDVLESKNY